MQWKQEILAKTVPGRYKVHIHHGSEKLKTKEDVKKYDVRGTPTNGHPQEAYCSFSRLSLLPIKLCVVISLNARRKMPLSKKVKTIGILILRKLVLCSRSNVVWCLYSTAIKDWAVGSDFLACERRSCFLLVYSGTEPPYRESSLMKRSKFAIGTYRDSQHRGSFASLIFAFSGTLERASVWRWWQQSIGGALLALQSPTYDYFLCSV